jgi:hypothetical protein
MMTNPVIDPRRALEALRNGVPNRDAVYALGCGQARVEGIFRDVLAKVPSAFHDGNQAPGILVAGGFGTGKSHLLEYLEHVAQDANFVCSRVVISKETPLHDPSKVFISAVESAVVPNVTGQAIAEIALRLKPADSRYVEFWKWANDPNSGVSALFPATLFLHERVKGDPDLVEKIVAFWSGEKIAIRDVRDGLKRVGEMVSYPIKAVKVKQLGVERFLFVARLIRGAGYSGWLLLIDEAELVGRYSLLQRGKSYAEIAKWLGRIEGVAFPGLVAVIAITDDFAAAVLDEKGDRDYVGPKLRSKDVDEYAILAARAEAGMRLIEREAITLDTPDELRLNEIYHRLKQLHSEAYKWTPPDVETGEQFLRRPIRSYVRRWINEWDLKRLYPGAKIQTQEEEIGPSYVEDAELEKPLEVADGFGTGQ